MVWSLGFAGLSLAMLVSGGIDVALIGLPIILVIFLVGGLLVQRYEDRQDLSRQAAAAPGTLLTPAVRLLPRNAAAQKGDLRLSSQGLSWIPGKSSTAEPFNVAWSDTAGVGVQPRGRVYRRASIIVTRAPPSDPLLFVTAARLERLLRGLDELGAPAARDRLSP